MAADDFFKNLVNEETQYYENYEINEVNNKIEEENWDEELSKEEQEKKKKNKKTSTINNLNKIKLMI